MSLSRRLSLAALAVIALSAAGCDLDTRQKGTFNLKNGTDATMKLLVSDNDQCIIGLHSEVATNTWRNYDIEDVAAGAFLCIDGKPHTVTNGKSYAWTGGALNETAAP